MTSSTDVANVDGPPGASAPASRTFRPVTQYHVVDRPEVIDRTVPGVNVLDPIDGVPDRPQKGWIAYFEGGQHKLWPRYTGDHGVIGLPREAPHLQGGQQPYPNWSPRTFRAAPLVPWDTGSEQG